MTNEQAAMERLRTYKRGWDDADVLSDLRTLALAYLAEHRADDDTPVDETWLRSVGFSVAVFANGDWEAVLRYGVSRISLWRSGVWELGGPNGDVRWPNRILTRGDVRRLCRDLGIKLEE